MDVRVRIVREHARLHIARGIDVQVATPAGNAAAHEFAVILEVEREQGLRLAHLAHEVVQVLALCGVGNKIGRRTVANRHERENPGEQCALVDKPIEVFFRRNGARILSGVAA